MGRGMSGEEEGKGTERDAQEKEREVGWEGTPRKEMGGDAREEEKETGKGVGGGQERERGMEEGARGGRGRGVERDASKDGKGRQGMKQEGTPEKGERKGAGGDAREGRGEARR